MNWTDLRKMLDHNVALGVDSAIDGLTPRARCARLDKVGSVSGLIRSDQLELILTKTLPKEGPHGS